MSVSLQVARRDFSAKTLRALSRKGITLVGATLLPVAGSWANADRGYTVNDNGTCRVFSFRMVLEAAQ